MTTQPMMQTAECGALRGRSGTGLETMRARSASEVLAILEPPAAEDPVIVPTGLWKTGWLPRPQGVG